MALGRAWVVVKEYVGGYSDWQRQRTAAPMAKDIKPPSRRRRSNRGNRPAESFPTKEQRELDQLPVRIGQLEKEQADVQSQLADPELYKCDPAVSKQLSTRLKDLETELGSAYARWEILEARRSG